MKGVEPLACLSRAVVIMVQDRTISPPGSCHESQRPAKAKGSPDFITIRNVRTAGAQAAVYPRACGVRRSWSRWWGWTVINAKNPGACQRRGRIVNNDSDLCQMALAGDRRGFFFGNYTEF